jgi:hypothetical protein
MSHFTVLVVGDDAEGQLARFSEKLEVKFNDVSAEELLTYTTGEAPAEWDTDDSRWFWTSDGTLRSFTQMYDTFFQYMKGWCGYKPTEVNGELTYGYWFNPDAKWDWYQLGGRWRGYFAVKPGVTDYILGHAGTFDNKAKPGYVDMIKKGDVDVEKMQRDEAQEATEYYDKFLVATDGIELPKPFSEFEKEFSDLDDARAAYHAQPFIQAMANELRCYQSPFKVFYITSGGKERYIKERVDNILSTFAALKDDVWYERGEMGWFGYAANIDAGWDLKFKELWDSIPDDTYVSLYDCHI